jgi:CubicO group peptidase (beta-lactamase class C family)
VTRAYASPLATLSILIATAPAHADAVDDYIQTEMKNRHIPGLSVAVVKDGTPIKIRGYGLANVEHEVPATEHTIYQSGSVGKQFTATLVMMLVEEGKVGLDDPVSKYFPEAPAAWKDITVRHLLTHTSGIPDYEGAGRVDLHKNYTENELVKVAAAFPLQFKPSEKWRYSNTNYMLLGILIGRVTGKYHGDYLKERVFQPLHMDTARIISDSDIVPHRAAGYRRAGGVLKNQDWVSPTLNRTADGCLYFTVLDMIKWDAAQNTEQLLKRSSLEQMWTRAKLTGGKTAGYGFGWALGKANGHTLIEHGGAWQGFTAHIARYVDDRLTVIVLTNLAGANPGIIAHKVAELTVPALAPKSEKPAGVGAR